MMRAVAARTSLRHGLGQHPNFALFFRGERARKRDEKNMLTRSVICLYFQY
jgi:hypothetical protein